jgi:hypothetical protein
MRMRMRMRTMEWTMEYVWGAGMRTSLEATGSIVAFLSFVWRGYTLDWLGCHAFWACGKRQQ